MRHHMWDEAQGCFLAVHRDGLRKLGTATVGGLVPLYAGDSHGHAGCADGRGAGQPALEYAGAHTFSGSAGWAVQERPILARGRVAGDRIPNAWRAGALRPFFNVVDEMAGRLLDNALKVGVSESYDSQTGSPLGVPYLGMSAILLTIALEGLSPRHVIRVA
jgi:hypothetical protein